MRSLRTRAGSRRRGRNPRARHWRRRVGSGRRKAPGRRRATREGGTPESWPRPAPHRRTHACAPQGTKARPQCARPGRRTRDEPWPMRPRGPRRLALPSRRRETRSRARGQQSAGQQTHRTRRARRMSPTSLVPRRHARQAGTASRAQGSQASCRQQGLPRPNGPLVQGRAGRRRARGHRTARRQREPRGQATQARQQAPPPWPWGRMPTYGPRPRSEGTDARARQMLRRLWGR